MMKNKNPDKALLAFRDLVKDIFEPRLKKVIWMGGHDVLLLFSSLTPEDQAEVSHLTEEWSRNVEVPVSAIALDEKSYKKIVAEGKQLAKDIKKTGLLL